MKNKWLIALMMITVFMIVSCKQNKTAPSKTETPNEDIMESKQEGMEQAREWKGERQEAVDTASSDTAKKDTQKKDSTAKN
ncbi:MULTISPECIES: hypothetical protein [Galbibacter]|uniref:Lipoprotein n=1 Tax=Galbibacter pacificus TaxID=2996052 RepID=A0ABT6FUS5_9FLAO|nr:hypothetical protein [Galbibacter pacificus]MDG3583672.1 hypothetical protein [Galbibacter pacificus]MDG3586852.1 hypothetical protein [Galbibacter pacificus]